MPTFEAVRALCDQRPHQPMAAAPDWTNGRRPSSGHSICPAQAKDRGPASLSGGSRCGSQGPSDLHSAQGDTQNKTTKALATILATAKIPLHFFVFLFWKNSTILFFSEFSTNCRSHDRSGESSVFIKNAAGKEKGSTETIMSIIFKQVVDHFLWGRQWNGSQGGNDVTGTDQTRPVRSKLSRIPMSAKQRLENISSFWPTKCQTWTRAHNRLRRVHQPNSAD